MKRALLFGIALLLAGPACAQQAVNGIALYGAPKYGADFTHFDYINPDAPKGGALRLGTLGTYDTLNPFTLKGVAAEGSNIVFETLMESSLDEPMSQYGWLAESVTVAPDRSWVAYKLRPQAHFHDGAPVTADDVIFSFETLRDKGSPVFASYYKNVAKVEKTADGQVRFTFKDTTNSELTLIMGHMPIFEKKSWQGRDFSETTLTPIVGSGPYEIADFTPGQNITYKRVKDWWAKDIPVNHGRYNFDTIRFDYYRDATVLLQGFFAGQYDIRVEDTAKYWAIAYDTPAVKEGLIKKEEIKNELPSGMQGFFFNTRRPIFQDRLVREALVDAFDYEWSNKNVAYGAYKRTESYFDNSEMAASGLPSPDELKLLEPWRGKIPDEVFTQPFQLPKTDGSGNNRENLRKALQLLKQAGWELKDGKLTNAKGELFKFEIVDFSDRFERWIQPFLRNLEQIGVSASFRVVDPAQYQNLMNDFNYDMTIGTVGEPLSPSNEQIEDWASSRADVKGSNNYMGVKNPAIDDLLDKLVHVKSREELITVCHALDRVLSYEYFLIPHWHIGIFRVAYWDMFAKPPISPKYGLDVTDGWWLDAGKAPKIINAQKRSR